MGTEIERKFLVVEGWRAAAAAAGTGGELLRQGYLSSHRERTVRVRRHGDRAKLTIKGLTVGASRPEFEYDIPVADAEAMLGICELPLVEKRRHAVPVGDHVFEIDEFLGANEGLVVAEVELGHEDEAFDRPAWLGAEVTADPRYYNANLIARPYRTWKDVQG
jgi:adenylate cyclase